VIAGPDGASSILAVRNGRERRLFTGVGTRVGALEASPGGRYLAARLDGTVALLRTDLPGTRALPSAGELVRAIAWSPDDRLAAVVTERYVHVFPVLRPREDVRLPVSLAFVRWR
jgi:WD40 repeat protein